MADATTVRVQALDGTWETIGADRAAGVWHEDLSCEADGWGSSRCSFTVRRDPMSPWPDIGAFSPVDVEAGGLPVWSGRVAETPSHSGTERSMSVQCEGWQFHLDDDPYSALYVHNDLSAWKDARGYAAADLSVYRQGYNLTSDGALTLGLPQGITMNGVSYSAFVLDLGPGNGAIAMSVDVMSSFNSANHSFYVIGSDDPFFVTGREDWISNLLINNAAFGAANTLKTFTGTVPVLTTPKRYISILLLTGTTGVVGAEVYIKIAGFRAFAQSAYQSAGASILKATDVVVDGLARGTKLLSTDTTGVKDQRILAQSTFTSASAVAVTGTALDSGGSWTGFGNADFVTEPVGDNIQRTAVSDAFASGETLPGRYIRAGTTATTAIKVQTSVLWTSLTSSLCLGVFARWADLNNHALAYVLPGANRVVFRSVAGAVWQGVSFTSITAPAVSTFFAIRLEIDTDGTVRVYWGSPANLTLAMTTWDASLATGASLASGGYGIVDSNPSPSGSTRVYDDFVAYAGTTGTNLSIPTYAPAGPHTLRENWSAVDAFHDWDKRIDVFRRGVYRARPTAPVVEVGRWSEMSDDVTSANSGEDIYNGAIIAGTAPEGVNLEIARTAGQATGAPFSSSAGVVVDNPSFDANTTSWTAAGAGGTITRDTVVFDSSTASGRFNFTNGNTADLKGTLSGTFLRGVTYRLDFALRGGGTAGLKFGHEASGDYTRVKYLATSATQFNVYTVTWTPTADRASGVGLHVFTYPQLDPSDPIFVLDGVSPWYVDSLAVKKATPTIVDRRGFLRRKILPISSALPSDLVAGTVIGDTWLAGHKTTPFKGSVQAQGRGAFRDVKTGAEIPPAGLLTMTGQLMRFGDRIDPDTGGVGRDGRIAGVSWTAATDAVSVTIDSSRGNFEALMARFDLLAGGS